MRGVLWYISRMFPPTVTTQQAAQVVSEPAENSSELRVSRRQIEDVLRGISRALPDRDPHCLRLVDQRSLPVGAKCLCQRCVVQREMIHQKRLGPSWNVIGGYIVA